MRDETKIQLKQFMLRDKSFLKSLYLSNPLSNKTTLSFSPRSQLITLIKVLFYITRGEIPLKKVHYEKLVKSKKRDILHKISSVTEAKKVDNTIAQLKKPYQSRAIKELFVNLHHIP